MASWSLAEVETLAKAKLSRMAYDYAAGGAGEELTLSENEAAYRRWRLMPRTMVDVSERDLRVTLLGREHPVPFGIAPTAFHRLFHAEGEMATARAAATTGVLHCVSTLANVPLDTVATAGQPRWFQLYIHKDRALTLKMVERAEASGYEALVLTVDSPVWGMRPRDVRNGFTLPDELRLANVDAQLDDAGEGADGLFRYVARQLDPSLTWKDLDWLREHTRLPILVKGILTAEDARLALDHGAAGVVVSNHGARQLDRVPATLDALPAIVDAVDGRAPVLLDGGIRRGVDIVTALALGADFVLVGRPIIWGLAADGANGVARVLDLLRAETDNALALLGRTDIKSLDRTILTRA